MLLSADPVREPADLDIVRDLIAREGVRPGISDNSVEGSGLLLWRAVGRIMS